MLPFPGSLMLNAILYPLSLLAIRHGLHRARQNHPTSTGPAVSCKCHEGHTFLRLHFATVNPPDYRPPPSPLLPLCPPPPSFACSTQPRRFHLSCLSGAFPPSPQSFRGHRGPWIFSILVPLSYLDTVLSGQSQDCMILWWHHI